MMLYAFPHARIATRNNGQSWADYVWSGYCWAGNCGGGWSEAREW